MDAEAAKLLAAGLCMGLGAIGSGIGEGFVGSALLTSMSRNPKMADALYSRMFVVIALVESTAIYSLAISIMLLFVV